MIAYFSTALALASVALGLPNIPEADNAQAVQVTWNAVTSDHVQMSNQFINRWVALHQVSEEKRAVGHSVKAVVGSAPLRNFYNNFWTCPTKIGNSNVFMILDTGSGDTWVRGTGCTSPDTSCKGGNSVSPTDSSLTNLNAQYYTQYGSGYVKGDIFEAPVELAGNNARIPIGVSYEQAGIPTSSDGLFGLGFDSISRISRAVNRNANFVDALGFPQSQNGFSFYLNNYNEGRTGQVIFGGYNGNLMSGPIHFVPLNAQTYWQFDMSQMTWSVGSQTGSMVTSGYSNVISDTGTTMVHLTSEVAAALNGALNAVDVGSGYYSINCGLKNNGPTVKINMNGFTMDIDSSFYVLENGDGTCISGFNGRANSLGINIWGAVITRAYYTIYDKGNSQVGFARAVHG
ncbi:aspartic peptidase domain-containing protein [Globomyces pollinis-pini]|nr:aspartic peptidase domain-containing protein [Globomyces pollinis-pini]KAJ2998540.1 hypothetical protein HDV02_004444 [Globomyces sp. JEL0801]